ncbi:hypothetical protein [Nannocystis punicea]|uniref:Uncharacterized protein n=1 Tax=Nannocystis punicea TaxID=2995304 RepID=A0ABY7GZN4_9BACT|nr:hypothetical protein [Nannocystis poenicansa]WAS92474.1 hypothetical protein O0S08_40360 [Nannocystis poenicansa]
MTGSPVDVYYESPDIEEVVGDVVVLVVDVVVLLGVTSRLVLPHRAVVTLYTTR